jgi:hypothetical protein
MRRNNIFGGLFLVLIGLIFLAINFDLITIRFHEVIDFWPVILIFLGISAIAKRSRNAWIAIAAILAFVVVFFGILKIRDAVTFGNNDNTIEWDQSYDKHNKHIEQQIDEEYNSAVKRATLSLDAAVGEYTINGVSEMLFQSSISSNVNSFVLDVDENNDEVDLDFKMMDNNKRSGRNAKNNVKVSLSANPEWDFNFDIGAANFIADLSSYKVSSLDIDAGAANVEIKLGSLQRFTNVNIDVGAASLEINIPKSSGCRITSDSGFSSKDFNGFDNKGDGIYETENYNSAENKVDIDLDLGMASIEVNRYTN